MRTSMKERRSERILALHRLILSVLTSSGAEVLKEIVTTVDVSQHGARIRGRRTLEQNWTGVLVHLNTGRQVPFRVVWQVKAPSGVDYMESGLEILTGLNLWGRTFSNPDAELVQDAIVIENATIPPEELVLSLRQSSAFQTEKNANLLEAFWCGLVEQLEERNVFTRTELVASIRRISQLMERPNS